MPNPNKKFEIGSALIDYARIWRRLAPLIRKASMVHAFIAEMDPHERILHVYRERFQGMVTLRPKQRRKKKRHSTSTPSKA